MPAKPTPIEIDTMPQLDPYHRDTGQETKTAFIFDLETGEYSLAQVHDDNTTTMDVWEGRTARTILDQRPAQHAAMAYLTDDATRHLLLAVLNGFSIRYDNNNNRRGVLTLDAQNALDQVINDLNNLLASGWDLFSLDEWLSSAGPLVNAETTNADIEKLTQDIIEGAKSEHVILIEDEDEISAYLYDQRVEELPVYLTTAEAAALVPVSAAHMRKLIAAGAVPGEKRGGNWFVPAHRLDYTRQRKA